MSEELRDKMIEAYLKGDKEEALLLSQELDKHILEVQRLKIKEDVA